MFYKNSKEEESTSSYDKESFDRRVLFELNFVKQVTFKWW